MPRESSLATPLSNPVIYQLTRWAEKWHPELRRVHHVYCDLADEAHAAERRLYAHAFCECQPENTICWARASSKLKPNTMAGLCIHEFGHLIAGDKLNEAAAEKAADLAAQDLLDPFGLELRYRGITLLQWVDFGRLLREMRNA